MNVSIKSELLRLFDEGKTVKEVGNYYSTKTVYKYYRLHLIIQIKNRLQYICDSEDIFETLEVPRLKVLLREVKNW